MHYNGEVVDGAFAGGNDEVGIVSALPAPQHEVNLNHKHIMIGHLEAAKQSLQASSEDNECDPFDDCPICAQIPSTQLQDGGFSLQFCQLKKMVQMLHINCLLGTL